MHSVCVRYVMLLLRSASKIHRPSCMAVGWNVSDCLFCAAYGATATDLPWYDRPLVRRPDVGVTIAGVGAFVPGYVLVAPAEHKSSMQGLPPPEGRRFVEFVHAVVRCVESRFGPATIFEHGSCRSEERRRSACITHSHIHVIPGRYSFDMLGLDKREYAELVDLVEVPRLQRADGYLMYREPGRPVCYAPDMGVSQFFRRHIARVLGVAEEWDYALYPRWEHVRITQSELAKTASLTAA